MSKNNSHLDDSPARSPNQNNQISDDSKDGHRPTDNPEARTRTAAEKAPPQDKQNQATIEDFGKEGMGLAAKE